MITATYLINCMPTRILEGQTPFEMLCGRQTMIDHLRVVGCLCYVATVGLGDKIDPCALPYVFMGYSSLQKGYQVMEISSGCFFASRDVVFHEDVFPFETIVSSSQPIASSSSHELLLLEDDLLRDPQYILMTLGLVGPANPDSLNATSESPTSYEEHHSSYSSMASPSPLAIESFLAILKETITRQLRCSGRSICLSRWTKDYICLTLDFPSTHYQVSLYGSLVNCPQSMHVVLVVSLKNKNEPLT